MKPHEVH